MARGAELLDQVVKEQQRLAKRTRQQQQLAAIGTLPGPRLPEQSLPGAVRTRKLGGGGDGYGGGMVLVAAAGDPAAAAAEAMAFYDVLASVALEGHVEAFRQLGYRTVGDLMDLDGALRRGTWARVTIDRFRLLSLCNFKTA